MIATHMVHWPGQDTPACDTHKLQLEGLAHAMGFTVHSTRIHKTNVECANCVKEAAKGFVGVKKEPVDAQTMRKMEALGRLLADKLDEAALGAFKRKEFGFALFLFTFEGAELTYISNAEREQMVKTLAEFIAANPPAMTWDEQHG